MRKITLGFSPCPNDTFIFDALVNKKIDTGDYEFDIVLEDVQTLNQWAMQEKLDFTKLSYGVLPLVIEQYKVLNSGSALGKGVGPLLISKGVIEPHQVADFTIAIPGENTTAHMLFSLAFPDAKKKHFCRYDEVENLINTEENLLGVIIHENRFTYADRGFHKITDLGEYWEQKMNLPIPLGGITGKRSLPEDVLKEVDALIKKSIQYAFSNYPLITEYVKVHSQEMSPEVMKKHIDLYVNDYSIDLGQEGKNSILSFLKIYDQVHGIRPELQKKNEEIFV